MSQTVSINWDRHLCNHAEQRSAVTLKWLELQQWEILWAYISHILHYVAGVCFQIMTVLKSSQSQIPSKLHKSCKGRNCHSCAISNWTCKRFLCCIVYFFPKWLDLTRQNLYNNRYVSDDHLNQLHAQSHSYTSLRDLNVSRGPFPELFLQNQVNYKPSRYISYQQITCYRSYTCMVCLTFVPRALSFIPERKPYMSTLW